MLINQPHQPNTRNLPLGIFHSLVACLYWSFVFVIPCMLSAFDEIDLVLARYVTFGCFSVVLIFWKKNRTLFKNITCSNWLQGFLWASLTIVYYFGIALAIRFVGSAITIIIAGLAPVLILFYANTKTREVPYSLLSMISLIIFAGVVLTNLAKFKSMPNLSLPQYIFGLSCVIFSTLIWVAYVICNQTFLEKNPHISSDTWGLMLGVGSLVLCIPLIVCGDLLGFTHITHNILFHKPLAERFLFTNCCLIMGIFSSSLAICSWNKASLYLSPALLGALLIFEPIFGLILSYVYEQALPAISEALGIFLMLIGSLLCVVLFQKKHKLNQSNQ